MIEEIKATHVLILGSLFAWGEKAPYVESGHSILGALEYNEELQVLKCHECGGWKKNLGPHVRCAHAITAREYRRDRGLRSRSPLHAPGVTRYAGPKNFRGKQGGSIELVNAGKSKIWITGPSEETRNLHKRCRAQLTERIIRLAISLNRTPSSAELKKAGIHWITVVRVFEMPYREALESIGLTANRSGAQPGDRNQNRRQA